MILSRRNKRRFHSSWSLRNKNKQTKCLGCLFLFVIYMASSVEKPNQTTTQLEPLPPSQHHHHQHHQPDNQISFGMMQSSSSTSLPGNFMWVSFMYISRWTIDCVLLFVCLCDGRNKDSAYDLGELDQALFLYLNEQTDPSSIQDQKRKLLFFS